MRVFVIYDTDVLDKIQQALNEPEPIRAGDLVTYALGSGRYLVTDTRYAVPDIREITNGTLTLTVHVNNLTKVGTINGTESTPGGEPARALGEVARPSVADCTYCAEQAARKDPVGNAAITKAVEKAYADCNLRGGTFRG